jgi:hypothetical protein
MTFTMMILFGDFIDKHSGQCCSLIRIFNLLIIRLFSWKKILFIRIFFYTPLLWERFSLELSFLIKLIVLEKI